MSRLSFATINDAFGITEFTPSVEDSYKIKEPVDDSTKVIESFVDSDEITCEVVKNHCNSCDCMGPTKKYSISDFRPFINELLNLLLIGILLYILLFKPKI